MSKQLKKYSWSQITIAKYRRLLSLPKDDDYAFNLVAVFEGCELKEIMNNPIAETLECTAALNAFIQKTPRSLPIKSKYELNGKVYCISRNPADVSTAQYFDFINTPKQLPDNLSQILAIFMVPEGKEYNTGYDIESAIYDIENYMNVEEALGVCDFFTTLFRVYSRKIMRQTKRLLKKAAKDGVPADKIQEAQDKLETYCRLIKYWKWSRR